MKRPKRPPVRYRGTFIPWADRPLEKEIQRHVRGLLELVGFKVSTTSQYRASGVRVGLSDLLISHPSLVGLGGFEVKRPGEPLTEKQREFALECWQCNAPYCWGTDEDAQWWLVSLRMGSFDHGVFCARPRSAIEREGIRPMTGYIRPRIAEPQPWDEELKTRIAQLPLL